MNVTSRDGTRLAVELEGEGPAIVLVHGSIADHTTFASFVEALAPHMTTFAMDRRGFGGSGDSREYVIERDFEDVAAVVDTVAELVGGPVVLFGHSYGANCAMGATALTDNVSDLVLYEPSLGLQYPPGAIERIEKAVAAGDNEAAIVTALVDLLEMTEEEIDGFRSSPVWPLRLAAAPTIPRECRVEESWEYTPGQFDAITAPTLLLSGSDSVPVMVEATKRAAAAIPNARVQVLDGHAHFAHRTDPQLMRKVVADSVQAPGRRRSLRCWRGE
jgi:pimeloyl-ACP methyl ester carboxylesterase